MQAGEWQEQLSGESVTIKKGESLSSTVAANGVQVWVRQGEVTSQPLIDAMTAQMKVQ